MRNSTTSVDALPPFLSRLEKKRELFSADPFFCAAWGQIIDRWGSETRGRLWRLSSVIFKPEAVVGRSIGRGLAFLRRCGFTPVTAHAVQLARDSVEEIARYQINVATTERVEVVHQLTGAAPSLLTLMVDKRQPLDVPATVRLVGLKGHVDPARRPPQSLRSALGSSSRLVNHVHTPDEPADVVRELGVLIDPEARSSVLDAIEAEKDRTAEAEATARRLYAAHPRHDLDFDGALDRIDVAAQRLEGRAAPRATELTELRRLCHMLRTRRDGDHARLFELADALGVKAALWDRIVVAAELVEADVPGEEPTLPTVGIDLWRPAAAEGT
jgi:nucleoside diphosphate kinase